MIPHFPGPWSRRFGADWAHLSELPTSHVKERTYAEARESFSLIGEELDLLRFRAYSLKR